MTIYLCESHDYRRSHDLSHDHVMLHMYLPTDLHVDSLHQMVDTVTRRAQVIANRAYAHRRKFHKSMTHPHSRSHDNLVELQEGVGEEEEARRERLKFPSDYSMDSTYHHLLQDREEALLALRGLAHASRGPPGPGGKREGGAQAGGVVKGEELEVSISEPDLHRGMCVCVCAVYEYVRACVCMCVCMRVYVCVCM